LDKIIFTLRDLLANEEDSLSSMSLDDEDDDEYDIDSDVSSVASSDASSVSTVTSLFQKIISFANHLFGPKKNLIQYVSYQFAMTIDSLPDNTYINVKEFQFKKAHLKTVTREIWERYGDKFGNDYNKIDVGNRVYIKFETGLLLVLYRLSYPHRVRPEIEERFRLNIYHLSVTLRFFFDKLYDIAILYLTDISLWEHKLPSYAHLVREKCGGDYYLNVYTFIDGTIRRICRPVRNQKAAYSGHKRYHGIKFQSVFGPEGFYMSLHGPYMQVHDTILAC
jgi:hypothetical protein